MDQQACAIKQSSGEKSLRITHQGDSRAGSRQHCGRIDRTAMMTPLASLDPALRGMALIGRVDQRLNRGLESENSLEYRSLKWRSRTVRNVVVVGSEAEDEFQRAMQEYKQTSGRMFPTWSEVLEVLNSLGYQKTVGERAAQSELEAKQKRQERD
jgi:hypothetical protein